MSSRSGLLSLIGSLIGLCSLLFLSNKLYYDGLEMPEDDREEEIDNTAWMPEGFKPYNEDIAFKPSEQETYTCSTYADGCLQMEVISRNGCDRLYVEVVKLDEEGNNVGYTNDTTAGLAPNQKAVLKFDSYGKFKTFQLSEISCY